MRTQDGFQETALPADAAAGTPVGAAAENGATAGTAAGRPTTAPGASPQ